MDGEMKRCLEEMEARQRANLERVETDFLREFWKWAGKTDVRTRQATETTNALNERMLNAERPHLGPRAQQTVPTGRRPLNRRLGL